MNPYTDTTKIQDDTQELLDRYDDRPEVAPTAAEYPPETYQPQDPMPNGQSGVTEND